jgi:hypothetical protein
MSINYDQNNNDNKVDRELKIFEIINGKIEHEDNLFVGRITWFVSLQALLFFPIFLIYTQTIANLKNLTKLSGTFLKYQENILIGLILTGLSFCLIVLLGCQAAHLRINQLTELYKQKEEQFREAYSDYLHLVLNVQSPPFVRFLGFLASLGSIFIFSKLWLFLEVISHADQNIVIVSFIIVTIIDSITIYNLFDCIFDFLRYDKHQKSFNQISLNIIVISVEIFICLYTIYNKYLFLIFLFFIVIGLMYLMSASVFSIKLRIFRKEEYRKRKK